MKNWKECGYYQEMYDLKHTWNKLIPCSPATKLYSSNKDCKHCPLFKGVESEKMINPYAKEDIE